MKRFYDIYFRPAGEEITEAAIATGNILSGFDKLDLPDKGSKLTTEPELRDLGDGTLYTEAEKVSLECATLRVDIAEYSYLRSVFHNSLVDVMLYDPNDHMILALAYRMRMQVMPIQESAQSALIKLTASRLSADANLELLITTTLEAYGVLTGKVYMEDGSTPVEDVLVRVTVEAVDFEDLTDKDGEFLICLPKGTHTYTPGLSGWTFPETTSVVDSDQQTIAYITATADKET